MEPRIEPDEITVMRKMQKDLMAIKRPDARIRVLNYLLDRAESKIDAICGDQNEKGAGPKSGRRQVAQTLRVVTSGTGKKLG